MSASSFFLIQWVRMWKSSEFKDCLNIFFTHLPKNWWFYAMVAWKKHVYSREIVFLCIVGRMVIHRKICLRAYNTEYSESPTWKLDLEILVHYSFWYLVYHLPIMKTLNKSWKIKGVGEAVENILKYYHYF